MLGPKPTASASAVPRRVAPPTWRNVSASSRSSVDSRARSRRPTDRRPRPRPRPADLQQGASGTQGPALGSCGQGCGGEVEAAAQAPSAPLGEAGGPHARTSPCGGSKVADPAGLLATKPQVARTRRRTRATPAAAGAPLRRTLLAAQAPGSPRADGPARSASATPNRQLPRPPPPATAPGHRGDDLSHLRSARPSSTTGQRTARSTSSEPGPERPAAYRDAGNADNRSFTDGQQPGARGVRTVRSSCSSTTTSSPPDGPAWATRSTRSRRTRRGGGAGWSIPVDRARQRGHRRPRLSLQHRGISSTPPMASHRAETWGPGERPRSWRKAGRRRRGGRLTAACLLVRADVFTRSRASPRLRLRHRGRGLQLK